MPVKQTIKKRIGFIMEKKKAEKLHKKHILWILATAFILSLLFPVEGKALVAADAETVADTAGEIRFAKSTSTIKAGKTYTFKVSLIGTTSLSLSIAQIKKLPKLTVREK
ncbi:MAG: hypothetical protein HFJ06_01490 [Lachnospiraceae bacterium]|nr:hypothetical protein [Lachnospiraceae bacterium]